ncbi:hypothetical protein [Paenibacillus segetis]|uniref:Uncharacterized protein n=1 Tax=Paenibacillus segetis TaxID=1325360 RepID=A0ABQ1Y7A3_9BACL|nr:hypothetical protein [Paenibacillus segetis]GGH15348.1 hypothetical protein GCM10008013_09490 [Paenibacillus segetis]
MNVSNVEQRRGRLKQFLKILSEDPSLLNQDGLKETRSLSELLVFSGYRSCNEPVDMAEVLSKSLRKIGLEACSVDMMEHVMNGGTIDEFMNARSHRAT